MTTHIMCDIETLGTRPGFIVLGAAFVRFSDEAHCALNLCVPDQQALGLEIDPETHAWWGRQDPLAWQYATQNPVPLKTGLEYFATWLAWACEPAGSWPDRLIWCHGATFDCPLLGEVYRRAGIACPWQFWNVRDTRTLYDLAGVNPKDHAVPPPHIALNDAIGQTRAANEALAKLAKAHAPTLRYFYHTVLNTLVFTTDGTQPADTQEIGANEYIRATGTQALGQAA